jgi:hypothetical protein
MNARGILELAKATGHVDITRDHKLFTKSYFSKGRIVDLDSTHRIEVAKEGAFSAPFIFVASSETSGGQPDIAQCDSEENALTVIETILTFEPGTV